MDDDYWMDYEYFVDECSSSYYAYLYFRDFILDHIELLDEELKERVRQQICLFDDYFKYKSMDDDDMSDKDSEYYRYICNTKDYEPLFNAKQTIDDCFQELEFNDNKPGEKEYMIKVLSNDLTDEEQMKLAIKLCYEISKDKFNADKIPEVFYAMNAIGIFPDNNMFSFPLDYFLLYILEHTCFTARDLLARGFDDFHVKIANNALQKPDESNELYLKRICSDSELRALKAKQMSINDFNRPFDESLNDGTAYLNGFLLCYVRNDFYVSVTNHTTSNVIITTNYKDKRISTTYHLDSATISEIQSVIYNNEEIDSIPKVSRDYTADDSYDDEFSHYETISFYKYDSPLKARNTFMAIHDRHYEKPQMHNDYLKALRLVVAVLHILQDNDVYIPSDQINQITASLSTR